MPKFVLMALADQADDRGYCWPSQQLIAQKVAMGERTVRRHIKTLRELGLVTPRVRSSTRGRRSNGYQLHIGFSLGSGQPANLAGCGDLSNGEPADSSEKQGDFVDIPATGQTGRLRKRPDWPVAQEASGGRSLEANGGRLHIGRTTIKNHQTGPDQEGDPPGRGPGASVRVGSGREDADAGGGQAGDASPAPPSAGGRDPASAGRGAPPGPGAGSSGGGLSEGAAGLLGACLPESMRALDAAGAHEVAGLLRERVGAGWRPSEIRRVMDQRLPERYGRLASLVAYRLRANVDPGAAPRALEVAAGRERAEAARRRAEAIAEAGLARPRDRVFERALREAREQLPGATRLDQARRAAELVEERRGRGGVGREGTVRGG